MREYLTGWNTLVYTYQTANQFRYNAGIRGSAFPGRGGPIVWANMGRCKPFPPRGPTSRWAGRDGCDMLAGQSADDGPLNSSRRKGYETMNRKPLLFIMLYGVLSVHEYTDTAARPAARPRADEKLTVERIYGRAPLLSPLPSGIRWAGKSGAVSYIEKRGEGDDKQSFLVIRDVPSGRERTVCITDTVSVPEDLQKSTESKFKVGSYRWDDKGERIVFTFGGDLFTLEGNSGRVRRRTQSEGEERDPVFSPDGGEIAYTRDHDLFVLDLEDDQEVPLTATGCDTVLNGILDWVYMEELYTRGDRRSFHWSPDGRRLALLQMRESRVPRFPIVDWQKTQPETDLQHYPKAGDPNPVARVGIVRAEGGDIVWADTDTRDGSYIARLYWLGDSRGVAIEKLNRAQDTLTLMFADAESGEISVVFEETDSAWVNLNYLEHFYETKRCFLWGSERSGHQHLYLYNMDGSLARQLTRGDWEVTSLDGVDEKRGRVYFTANKSNILDRQLFEVSDRGGEIRQITAGEGTHRVTMSPDNRYFVDRFSSEKRPTVVSVYSVKGDKIFELADRMTPELAKMERPLPEFFTFESPAGVLYHCSIIKPADFDPGVQYPVIVYVYGGPHAQVVRRSWSSSGLWHSMMAEKGFIVFSLDNRGSYGRGKKWEDAILRNLGHYELEDQLAGVDYLRTLPYVDPERIGIWGWSYGGFMTLTALFKAPEVFGAGVAVAPVTDWRLYDSIYTERYMKLPEDNEEGYRTSAPINYAGGYRGELLLMHGDADDNVHFQNSVQLVKKLIDAGRDFEFMMYPQKTHGISGPVSRVFLFNKVTEFFEEKLLDR
jgi:dipeptidyl-peptidase-4